MTDKEFISAAYIFITGMFFSLMGWLNSRSRSDKFVAGKTPTKVKIEGFTHTVIGAFIAVCVFAWLLHFYPDLGTFLQGTLSVAAGAFLGETIIKFAEKRINNA